MGTPANRVVGVAEFITPEKAQEWLAKSSGNRKESQQQIDKLARDITAGAVMPTSDGVGFNWNGRLINGHHRLRAIIQARRGAWLLVVRGLDPESVPLTDFVKARNLPDAYLLSGKRKISPAEMARARVVANTLHKTNVVLSPNQFEDIRTAFGHSLDWSLVAIPSGGGRGKAWSKAPIAGAFVLAHSAVQHSDAVERFTARVVRNDGLHVGSVEHLLHSYVVAEGIEYGEARRRAGPRDADGIVVRKVLRCLHAYVIGERITKLQDSTIGLDFFLGKVPGIEF